MRRGQIMDTNAALSRVLEANLSVIILDAGDVALHSPGLERYAPQPPSGVRRASSDCADARGIARNRHFALDACFTVWLIN
ncbi:MAG TPA: hypothetical protein VEK11_07045 [Thermoanaerobaculia bacterium]|nr:hypothetical protein [Thermoanaerobaculia bacterium]